MLSMTCLKKCTTPVESAGRKSYKCITKSVLGAQEGSREGTCGPNKLCFSSGGQNRPAAGAYMSHRALQQHAIIDSFNLMGDIPLCFIFIITNKCTINLLTPNDDYSGRTAPLNSKCCILYIYSTNIGTE